jgi:hypothetical protein
MHNLLEMLNDFPEFCGMEMSMLPKAPLYQPGAMSRENIHHIQAQAPTVQTNLRVLLRLKQSNRVISTEPGRSSFRLFL